MVEMLTTKELAKELKVTTQTVYNWRKRGMPSVKVGPQYRHVLADVLEWLQNYNRSDREEEVK